MDGLFGEVPPARKKGEKRERSKKSDASHHNDLLYYWANAWEAKYGGKYPFTGADIGHISTTLRSSGSLEEAKVILGNYLQDSERFLAGHPLGKVVGQLSKYTTRKALRRTGEYPEPEHTPKAITPAADLPIDPDDIPF